MAETNAATEEEMVAMLRRSIEADKGNGPQGCVIAQVRNDAGFDARRTLDAVSMRFWKSHGLLLEGYECKSSRGDLLRELKAPEKAEQFAGMIDRFWIIAGGPGIAKAEELPEAWGLLVAGKNGLRIVKQPKLLHDLPGRTPAAKPLPPAFSRGFLVGMLRQTVRQQNATPEEIQAAVDAERQVWLSIRNNERESHREEFDALADRIRRFEEASGVKIDTWRSGPEDVGAAVRMVLDGKRDTEALERRLERIAEQAEAVAAEARRVRSGAD